MLTLILGVVLGSAILAILLVHQLGWALDLLAFAFAFAVVGGIGIAGPTSLLHAAWLRLDPSSARSTADHTTRTPRCKLVLRVECLLKLA